MLSIQQRPWWQQQQQEAPPPMPGTAMDPTAPPLPATPPPMSRFDMPQQPQPQAMPDMPQSQQPAPQLAVAKPMPEMPGEEAPEPAPTPAPAPSPEPIAPPSAPDPEALGRDPIRRARIIGAHEGADEAKAQGPTEDPRITAAKDSAAVIAAKSKEHVPAWRQVVGGALSLAPRTRGIGQMVLNPPDKAVELAPEIRKDAAEARLEETQRLNTELHGQQMTTQRMTQDSLAESRKLSAETRVQNAATFAERVKEQKTIHDRQYLLQSLGSKDIIEDSNYQKEGDVMQPGYSFIADPSNPGWGFAKPPAFRPLPKELAEWAPGVPVGTMIPHSEYRHIVDYAQKAHLEEAKAENKTPPLDAPTRTAIASFGGDPSKAEDVAKGRKLVQDDAVRIAQEKRPPGGGEGTWQLQETPDGKSVLFNSKTSETKSAPEGIQKTGTAARVAAAKEKDEAPARMALNYATDYLANGAFTGVGDEALQEKFFELAKPATGFRMTKPQMDMLQNSRSWMSGAAAHLRHATTGTWFDDGQRRQIVDTMKQLAAAKLKTAPQATGGAPPTTAAEYLKSIGH